MNNLKKKKENKVLISMRISPTELKKVDRYAKKLRFSRTKMIKNSIELFMENIDAQMEFLEKQKKEEAFASSLII